MSSQPTDMEVDNDKYKDTPAWFANYINDFRNYVDEYRHDKEKLNSNIKSLSDRLEVVEASNASLQLENPSYVTSLSSRGTYALLKLRNWKSLASLPPVLLV